LLGQTFDPADILCSFEIVARMPFLRAFHSRTPNYFPSFPPVRLHASRAVFVVVHVRRFCDAPERHHQIYNSQKGYGFIKPDDGGKDVFVHVTAVERAGINNLDEGARISFETEPDKRGKGPKAVNLQSS
jgi:CspA family cold shock protein